MKKEERILNALNDVDDGYITSAAPNKKATKKKTDQKMDCHCRLPCGRCSFVNRDSRIKCELQKG